jgi:putative hemolysin
MVLLVLLALVLVSAFFSCSETALTAVSRSKVKELVDKKIKGSKILLMLTQNPTRMLTTILVGNNFANVAISVLSTELIFQLLKDKADISFAWMTVITTAVVTLVVVLFGEVTPKNLAIYQAQWISPLVAPAIYFLSILFSPIVFVLNLFSKFIIFVFTAGRMPEKAGLITTEEMRAMVSLGESQGVLEQQEKEMIHSIFEFGDLVVKEVMTPRPDIVAVEMRESVENVLRVIEIKKHSRIPVYNGKLDNIIGILHVKDLLTRFNSSKRPMLAYENLSSLVRPAHFIPETKNVAQLFQYMRAFKNHIAIAVDEYGTVSGLITMENILEEIVGDIHDEFDKDTDPDPDIFESGKDNWIVKGTIAIDKINGLVGSNIPESSDYDSLAGFVFSLFGTIPSVGDSKRWENLIFKVERVRDRRILTVRITKN